MGEGRGARRPGPRVLVTGGSGFIGAHVVKGLVGRGERVRVLVPDDAIAAVPCAKEVEILAGDLREPATVEAATRGIQTVYHLGGLLAGNPYRQVLAVNAGGTEKLALACGLAGTVRRFVFSSSVAVYRQGVDWRAWPLAEDSPLGVSGRPADRVYGLSKIAAELTLRRWASTFDFSYTILRPALAYGVGSDYSEYLVRSALGDPYLAYTTDSRPVLQPIHVEDLAEAVVRAGGRVGENKLFNVAGSEPVSYRDLGLLVRRVAGLAERRPITVDRATWSPALLPYDISAAERVLGLAPRVSLAEGLAEIVESLV